MIVLNLVFIVFPRVGRMMVMIVGLIWRVSFFWGEEEEGLSDHVVGKYANITGLFD